MKYKEVVIPFVGKTEIKAKSDRLRKKLWGDKIPVGIENIIEIKLKIKIIPIPNLFKLCSVDSQISSDFSSIWVDQENYLYDHTNRLNFSLAHELGHYILHKDLFSSFGIKSIEDVFEFIREIPDKQYSFFETQANYFASYFLLPRESLVNAREEIADKYNLRDMDPKMVNSYISDNIAKEFEVSPFAAELTLNDLDSFSK